jgi:hypothetical protein
MIKDDNRIDNLRLATLRQNNCNKKSLEGSTSKYLGVHIAAATGKPTASISINNKIKYLGTFTNEQDAALAYNKAALEAHGEFANLNVV